MAVLTIRRKLTEAKALMGAARYAEAQRTLEDALSILDTSPFWSDVFTRLKAQVKGDLAAARGQRRREAEETLKEAIERIEEEGG